MLQLHSNIVLSHPQTEKAFSSYKLTLINMHHKITPEQRPIARQRLGKHVANNTGAVFSVIRAVLAAT
jgi:hypothetical protein